MMDNDFKEKSSLYILGKEFIIVVVVIFSALSFTLGYFVGKNARDEASVASVQRSDLTPLPGKQERLPVQNTQSIAPPTTENSALPQTADNQMPQQLESTAAPQRETDKTAKNEREIIYTVQLGAFSSEPDALKFKDKFDKKGYSAYITVAKNNRNENMYKVRIGTFTSRKEADIFSLKLKKAEGLATFVTFKNE